MLLRKGFKIPLDIIVSSVGKPKVFKARKILKNTLKNVVMNRIVEIRIESNKPKLSDFIKLHKAQNGISKEFLLNKLTVLYSNKHNAIEEDKKFDELNGFFDRMKKVF